MIRHCPIILDQCPGGDSAITGRSSEALDPIMFAGWGYDPFDPYAPTRLGVGPGVSERPDCANLSWSSESQVLADLLALLNARSCTPPTEPEDTFPDNPPIVLIPPLRAVNLTPLDGDPCVYDGTILTWEDGGGATSYHVYWDGVFQVEQTGTTFDPGTLTPTDVHTWRVDAVNDDGVTTGVTWSFTVCGPLTADNTVVTADSTEISADATIY